MSDPDQQRSSEPDAGVPASRGFEWDRLTAVMATLVAVCALAVSLYTAHLQNIQVRASTWPYLQLWKNDAQRAFLISNRGVGPAQVRDAKIRVDGVEVSTFNEAFERLAGRPLECAKLNSFARRVFAANEEVAMIEFCDDNDYHVFMNAGPRLMREICFCSLLDDCWRIDESSETESNYFTSVNACPVGKAGIFR
jgi:hypothetical protein